MHAEDFVVYERSDGHAVEDVLELLPNTNGVASLALIIKAIDAVDLSALVIAPQQEEVLLELHLVRQEQDDRLKTVLAPVNIIAQEQVVRLGREPPILEKSEQVRKLSMRVTADFYGRLKLEENRLLHENLTRYLAEQRHIFLLNFDVTPA